MEPESPSLLDQSKQTMYINNRESPMSPKLQLKAVGQEYPPQLREVNYRKTQPTFHITLEKSPVNKKSPSKMRGETPKFEKSSQQKQQKTSLDQQKELFQVISNSKERRPQPLHIREQSRRLKQTANLFIASEESSSKPDSLNNFTINVLTASLGKGNDDLADVSIKKEKSKKDQHKKQQQQRSPKIKLKTNEYNLLANKLNGQIQLTNLAQAYSSGVSKLIQTLPFQKQAKNRLHPILTASFEFNKSQVQQQNKINQVSGSRESSQSLPKGAAVQDQQNERSLRRPIMIAPYLKHGLQGASEISHQNSGQLQSNMSLHQSGYPLQGMNSSIFRIEPNKDYTDIKLDVTKSKNSTEYQSHNYLNPAQTIQNSFEPVDNKKAPSRPRKKLDKSPQTFTQIPTESKLPLMMLPRTTKNTQMPQRLIYPEMQKVTSTERRIQGILDKTDYHRLKRHRDEFASQRSSQHISNQQDIDQCTCNDHTHHQVSQSMDYSSSPPIIHTMRMSQQVTSSSKKGGDKNNVLTIIQRPLKGKAVHMKEYKTMIQDEYGKEKKKKIYETMYSDLKNRWQYDSPKTNQNYDLNSSIKLNLRAETQPVARKWRHSQHVQLRTISPRGDFTDKFVKLDEQKAQMMNTTMSSLGFDKGAADHQSMRSTSMVYSQSKSKTKPRQFFLFQPNSTMYQSTRYQESFGKDEEMSHKSSIVNLEIQTSNSKGSPQEKNQGNQINLGYVGMHEQEQIVSGGLATSVNSNEYFSYLMQDEVKQSSEMHSHLNLPFQQVYSRLSNDPSKVSKQSQPLNTIKDASENKKSGSPQQDHLGINSLQVTLAQKKKSPPRAKKRVFLPANPQILPPKDISGQVKLKKVTNKHKFATASQRQKLLKIAMPFQTVDTVSTQQINTLKTEKTESKILLTESPKMIDDPQTNNYAANRNNNQVTTIVINSESHNTPDDQSSVDQVNPLYEFNSSGSKENLDTFTNPAEISIRNIESSRKFQSVGDYEAQKMRHAQHYQQKLLIQQKPDERLGPLGKVPVLNITHNNYQPMSQITTIDGFYHQEDIAAQATQYNSTLYGQSTFNQ